VARHVKPVGRAPLISIVAFGVVVRAVSTPARPSVNAVEPPMVSCEAGTVATAVVAEVHVDSSPPYASSASPAAVVPVGTVIGTAVPEGLLTVIVRPSMYAVTSDVAAHEACRCNAVAA
jgi:hypothetical protein